MRLAAAQPVSVKPITIVCAQPPGSGPDTMLRLFAEVMGRNMGQRILVVNRPGAGGTLAATTVAQAAPDGYTLLLVLGGMHTIAQAMQKMPFDPVNDFTFISQLYVSSGVLLVPPQSPAKNFAELTTLLKSEGRGRDLRLARAWFAGASAGCAACGKARHADQACRLSRRLPTDDGSDGRSYRFCLSLHGAIARAHRTEPGSRSCRWYGNAREGTARSADTEGARL